MSGMRDYGYYSPPSSSEGRGRRSGGRTRLVVGVVGVAFAVSLAVIIGQRLSEQAVSVLSGAVCGVGASIPTSLLIVWVMHRRQDQEQRSTQQPAPGAYPPVVVVQSPPQAGGSPSHQYGYLPPSVQPARREFTVVGGEMEDVGFNG